VIPRPKPKWLEDAEREHGRTDRKAVRLCVNCANKGPACGLTNRTSSGRMVMYECRKFRGVTFHEKTYACSSYE
jgi:hypothetical protein